MALAAGAHGYLSKDRDAAQLVAAIRVAASGGYYLPPGLSPSQLASPPRQAPHLCLTEREQQILRLILQGISLTDIGTRLCLSVKTVSTYRTRLLGKLGVNSNAELVRYCLEHGVGD